MRYRQKTSKMVERERWKRWVWAIAGALLAAGCGDRAPVLPNKIQMIHSPLIGGTPDTGDPSVVALFAHARGDMTGQGALCTTTFISQSVLLTAAHCVSPAELANLGPNIEFLVIISNDLNQPGGRALAVRETHFDQAFDPNQLQNGHDVGIVILQNAVTNITPVPFNQAPMSQQMVGQPVRLVGYGVNDAASGSGSGTKRQLTTTLDDFDNLLLHIGDTGQQTCQGDSGGPALMRVNGVETIMGVTSFGNQDCSMGGYDTRIDDYVSFIDTYLNMTPPPPMCMPMCIGKSCGPDGCGHTCGSCGPNETCSPQQQCMTNPPPPPANVCDANNGRETEPNNSSGSANELCTNLMISGSISSADDQDWYHWTVPADKDYTVSLRGLAHDYTMNLFKVIDGQPEWIASAVDNHDGADQSIDRHSATGGTYYLQVVGVNGASDPSAPYTVALTMQ